MERHLSLGRRLPRVRPPPPSDLALTSHPHPRSGVFVIRSSGTSTGAYSDASYENDRILGARITDLVTPAAVRGVFPPGVRTGAFEGMVGYLNADSGWAAAAQGVEILLKRVRATGAVVVPGKAVDGLVKSGGKTTGVKCKDGSSYDAGLVVVASGSWTPSSFPKLDLKGKCLATG